MPTRSPNRGWLRAGRQRRFERLGGGAGQFSITYGTPAIAVTYYDVGVYFSDDWRWKPNFTVSYGLRYETQIGHQ